MALSPKYQKHDVNNLLKTARAEDVIENRLKVSLTQKKKGAGLPTICTLNNITYAKGK